ncbi:MAG TPA: hypothetical protein VNH18_17430 [Bryobacteraceae bacterium]|nr:hypothetical protein [Bryobacteraceae bacterium]
MKRRSGIAASAGLTLVLASALFAQQPDSAADGSKDSTRSSTNVGKESWARQAGDFVPLTGSERATLYAYSLFGPKAFVFSAAQAGFNQLRNSPREWGQGAEGYGRRYGSAYAQHVINATVANGIAFGLHEDNRYFKSGKTGMGRVGYAITSAFLARHDDGSRFISVSAIGGTAAGAFISRTWQPPSTSSMGSGAVSFGLGMGVRMGTNVALEFLPRRMERLFGWCGC